MAAEQLHKRLGLLLVAMIPMRMLENWLLADENAFKEAFGDHPKNPKLPTKPEFIWGDEQNPTSEHPKRYLHRVFEQYGASGGTENFVVVANATSIETLKQKCPNSFAPFAAEMDNFITKRA